MYFLLLLLRPDQSHADCIGTDVLLWQLSCEVAISYFGDIVTFYAIILFQRVPPDASNNFTVFVTDVPAGCNVLY